MQYSNKSNNILQRINLTSRSGDILVHRLRGDASAHTHQGKHGQIDVLLAEGIGLRFAVHQLEDEVGDPKIFNNQPINQLIHQ